jgi:integrase
LFKRSKKWYVGYYQNGRRVHKVVGTSKRLAGDVLKDIEGKQVRGELMDIREIKSINFDDFALQYLERFGVNKAESTRAHDQIKVDKHLIPFFGKRPLKQITAKDIEEYKAHRAACRQKNGKQIQKSTVNRELDLLKSLLARAVEWGYLKSSPSQGVRKFRIDEKEPVFLTLAQGAIVLQAATGQMRGFIAVGINAGLRKGEMFSLVWDDLDFERKELRVRKSKGKTFRVIPMNAALIDILGRHPRHIRSPYVFHNHDGTPWHDVRKGFEAALKTAGVRRIRIHDMRHTFVSNLVMQGVDLNAVKKLAGHQDITTTMKYAHLAPGHLKDSVERLTWKSEDLDVGQASHAAP